MGKLLSRKSEKKSFEILNMEDIKDMEKVIFDVVKQAGGEYRVLMPELRIREMSAAAATEGAMKQYIAPRFPIWENVSAAPWAIWGETDELPNWIYRNIMSLPLAAQAIRIKSKDAMGDGIQYVDGKALAQGDIQPIYEAEEEDFREKNRLETHYLPNQYESIELFGNSFSQMDMGKNDKIERIYHLDTPFSRLTKQSRKTGRIEYLMYSAMFGSGEYARDEYITTLPLYRWYDPQFFNWLKGKSFAWHTHLPTPGMTYYARQTWQGLLNKDSWLDTARNVAKIVNNLQHKQMLTTHQLIISDTYMKLRIGIERWDLLSPEQKFGEYEKVARMVEDSLLGVENAGTVLVNYAREINGVLTGSMEVKVIDSKMQSGFWIPDSAVANSEILNALGLHPSQMGLVNEGGTLGAGSGSDARVHFNSGIFRNTLEQKLQLEKLNFVCRHNGWKGRYIAKQSIAVQTNENKSGIQSPPNS